MTTHAHKKIAKAITLLDLAPDPREAFAAWIRAGGHLEYLQENAKSDERIIYASGPCSFVHTIAAPLDTLTAEDP
jgi:hypothetical protein